MSKVFESEFLGLEFRVLPTRTEVSTFALEPLFCCSLEESLRRSFSKFTEVSELELGVKILAAATEISVASELFSPDDFSPLRSCLSVASAFSFGVFVSTLNSLAETICSVVCSLEL